MPDEPAVLSKPKYTIYDGKNSAVFSVFNDQVFLSIYESGERPANGGFAPKTRVSNLGLKPDYHFMLVKRLKNILKAAPGTSFPIAQMKWNNEARQMCTVFQIVVGKDDTGIITLDISDASINRSFKFAPKLHNTVQAGSEPISDIERSIIGVEQLIVWLEGPRMIGSVVTNFRKSFDKPNPNAGYSKGSEMGGQSLPVSMVDDFPDDDE